MGLDLDGKDSHIQKTQDLVVEENIGLLSTISMQMKQLSGMCWTLGWVGKYSWLRRRSLCYDWAPLVIVVNNPHADDAVVRVLGGKV